MTCARLVRPLAVSLFLTVFGSQVPSHASTQVTPVIVKTFDGTEALLGGVSSSAVGGLIKGTDGAFYGVTQDSTNTRCGTVFKLANDVLTVLHEFQGSAGTPPDGCKPVGELVEASDGNLYGATMWGGSNTGPPWTSGAGTIFRISKDGSTYNGLFHDFGPFPYADGAIPQAGLTLGLDGILYGTTSYGGSAGGTCTANAGYAGTFYQLTLAGAFSVKHHFLPETDGCAPIGNLTLASDGSLLGATIFGGYAGPDAFAGTVFKVTSSGSFSALFMFPGSPGAGYEKGANPTSAPIEASDGTLWGTANGGGPIAGGSPSGTVYKLSPSGSGWQASLIHGFSGPDGSIPNGALAPGANRDLYGTTSGGGDFSNGTLFRVASGIVTSNLYSFAGPADGCCPLARLLEVSPGLFYGLVNGPGTSQGAIVSFTVGTATTTGLQGSPSTSVFGSTVSLTATVSSASGTPTGQVEFFDGATSLGSSALSGTEASLTTTTLSVGTHSALTAHYLGDGAYLESTSPTASVVVTRAQTTATLGSAPNPSARKQLVTVTATVAAVAPGNGMPTGLVQLMEGKKKLATASLANGIATFQLAFTSMGKHTLSATYAGDTNFVGSTATPLTQTVNK